MSCSLQERLHSVHCANLPLLPHTNNNNNNTTGLMSCDKQQFPCHLMPSLANIGRAIGNSISPLGCLSESAHVTQLFTPPTFTQQASCGINDGQDELEKHKLQHCNHNSNDQNNQSCGNDLPPILSDCRNNTRPNGDGRACSNNGSLNAEHVSRYVFISKMSRLFVVYQVIRLVQAITDVRPVIAC